MLTKDDLKQIEKTTRKVIREEVELEVKEAKDDLGHEIRISRMTLQTDIRNLGGRVKNLEIAANKLQKDVTIVKKDVKKLQKGLAKTSDFLDRENLRTVERVRKIEEHLDFPEPAII